MDIVVIPEGELGDDYKKKNEQLDSLREECTSLLFTDALNGDGANSERIAQLISDYKTLQAECDEMYNKFIEPYRAKIDKAFAELEDGADFAQVMLKYTENEYVAGSDSYGGCETFRTKGQLISTKHSSSRVTGVQPSRRFIRCLSPVNTRMCLPTRTAARISFTAVRTRRPAKLSLLM